MIMVTTTSELTSKQRNDAITYFICRRNSQHWELLFQNRSRELWLPIVASEFLQFEGNLWECYRDILGWSFYGVRNTLKTGQSWCLAVFYRKRSAFEMKLQLIVVSIFLKKYVKDHGDSCSRLLERRIWLVCIEALFLAAM